MQKHLEYLWYVIRHKWYVFLAGLRLGVPLWSLIIHDWHKFSPAEWYPYVMSVHGPWEQECRPQWVVDAFDVANLHHRHSGKHHWQYWILRKDNGEVRILEMPDKYRREMLADWLGAGKAITGDWDDIFQWYDKHRSKMILHERTREWIEREIEQL